MGNPSFSGNSQIDDEVLGRLAKDTAGDVSGKDDKPQYLSIDATDSPYAAGNNEYLDVDMSAGDVSITPPGGGRCWVHRNGSSNTLSLVGTISGKVNPKIAFDGSTAAIADINGKLAFV